MVAVAAVVIAASIFAVLPGGPEHPGSAAAATLLRLSGVAAAQPALLPTRAGQYYYSSYEYPQAVSINGGCALEHCEPAMGNFTVHYVYVEQFWVRPGQLTRIRVTRLHPTLDPATRLGWIASGRPSIARLLPRTYTETIRPTPHDASPATALLAVERLPTNPVALKAAVDAGPLAGPTYVAQNRFDTLAFVLSTGSASPRLRAAVFKVLATVQGVEDLGMVTDPLGRRGDAFVVAAGQRYTCDQSTCPASEMIIDPATGVLLDEASLNSHGTPTWTSYLAIGIADSIGSVPGPTR